MNTIMIVILTLVIYSTISTICFIISNENEELITYFGLGIVGVTGMLVIKFIHFLKELFCYRIGKRSIYEEKETKKQYVCKLKENANMHWLADYKMIKRYATKEEWKNLPYLPKEVIERSKINCNNCKYDKECQCDFPYDKIKCKNEYGTVLNFEKFEKK